MLVSELIKWIPLAGVAPRLQVAVVPLMVFLRQGLRGHCDLAHSHEPFRHTAGHIEDSWRVYDRISIERNTHVIPYVALPDPRLTGKRYWRFPLGLVSC